MQFEVTDAAPPDGGITLLPGMNDHDFDHCRCGLGWPMGYHHDHICPAHCVCGDYDKLGRKMTCAYHSGATTRVPVGPSLMTERWDLPEGQRGNKQNVQIVERRTSSKIQDGTESEEASSPAPLSRL